MSLFTVTERDRWIYEEELRDFLPPEIIDVHTHVWKDTQETPAPQAYPKRIVTWPSLVARDNSLEDIIETYRLMFPDKRVTPLMFTSSTRAQMAERNAYVRQCARKSGFPALYFSVPEETGEALVQRVREGGFLGLKSYLDLSPDYIPEAEIRIFDFFPHHQLEAMNDLGAIIMLHIPRNGRLRDPVNIAQMLEITRRYPRIRLIIAHIGRAYARRDIGDAFQALADSGEMMFDFSANTSEFAMTKLLEAVGPGRVLFGSDLPILRMRMRRIEENDTYINLVPPGLYGDARQDIHLREVSEAEGKALTFFMYEEILAFKRAAERVALSQSDINDVFYGNARALLDGARADIYGKEREE